MREVVVSAATLAGLVGLACLYSNDNQRVRRDAEFEAISDDYDVLEDLNVTEDADAVYQADYDFIKEMGLFDDSSDMPDLLKEDISMFSSQTVPGNQRASIQFATKCINNNACLARARAKCREWGGNTRKFQEQNWENFVKPVLGADEVIANPENQRWGVCTPIDESIIPCDDETANNSGKNVELEGPQGTKSVGADCRGAILGNSCNPDPLGNPSVNANLNKKIAEAEENSEAMNRVRETQRPSTDLESANNFFTQHGGQPVKIVLVVPNGIPISMASQTKQHYQAYWNFFKNMNERFIGVIKNKSKKHLEGRDRVFFWFLRQDKNVKAIQKSPVLATGKFPWGRFDKLMSKYFNSAAQPNLKPTYVLLNSKKHRLSSSGKPGQDCFVIWFHHYIPADVIDLSSTAVQENLISPLLKKCVVIHIWVGMDELENDMSTVVATKYLQGILNPDQQHKTIADPDYRGWFYIKDLETLDSQIVADNLAAKVYNIWNMNVNRVACLLTEKSIDFPTYVKEANAAAAEENVYDYYYASTTSTSVAGSSEPATTTMEPAMSTAIGERADEFGLIVEEEGLGAMTNTTAFTSPFTETIGMILTDEMCCGPCFDGIQYNTYENDCCDGEVVEKGTLCDANH
jgi:hypothetical protein